MSWRKHRFVQGWKLEHWRDFQVSYVLTVPRNFSSSFCQNKLKYIPGGTSEFITIDAYDGVQIFFRTSLPFNECVKWLSATFSLQSAKRGNKRKSKKRIGISQYTLEGQYIRDWESISQASKELGINPGGIWQTMKGRQKYAGGFVWKKNNN